MNNQNVLAAAPDHITDARKMASDQFRGGTKKIGDHKVVPVELLRGWHERINTIAAEAAFDVADEMEAMLSASPAVQVEPASGAVLSRDDLIQCLLATRGQSEGTTADAILSMIAAASIAEITL